jgi:hypothetical protein
MMAGTLRIVVLDHFFDQDISALREAAGPSVEWRVLPYWRLRNAANRRLPERVQVDLGAYVADELARGRRRYATWLHREIGRLYSEWPFDVFVLPSDTFYYVRDLPSICHELGIPVFVAQKETTITDWTFVQTLPDVRAYTPFTSDYMTVCSERHKRFWVEAGADPSIIEVTGQPRFDLYASHQRLHSWADVGLENDRPTVLFLSYHVDAYLEGAGDWERLRNETESVLFDATRHGWRVLVKLHPQQPRAEETRRLAAAAPRRGEVVLASEDSDTRLLLILADAVVGFQSTALLEAAALPKPVAYAGWGDLHSSMVSKLIPFPSLHGSIALPASATDLSLWLASPTPPDQAALGARAALAEEFVGTFDGHASERTLAAMQRVAADWRVRRKTSTRRKRLDRLALPAALGLAARHAAATVAFGLLERAGTVASSKRVEDGAGARKRAFAERFGAARRSLDELMRRRPESERAR